MNAVIYCRVSSKEQVEGTSLESQELACRDYARRNHLSVAQVFVDRGESAKFADRPQLLEMLAYCRQREHAVDQLLVWKVDRLARNVGDHFSIKASLMKLGVQVVSVTEPIDAKPEGRLLETILAGFAQFDNDIRTARTVQGMRSRLAEGISPWHPPLGYRGASRPGSKKQQPDQPDHPAFGILQEGWIKFATGAITKADFMRFLTSRGLKTRTGKKISNQLVDRILTDRFYAGILRDPWTGEELPGRHVPMVSRETFESVQGILCRRNRSLPHLARRPEFPLRTFVKCPHCAWGLTGSFSRGRSKLYPYYRCFNRRCGIHTSYPLAEVHGEFAQFLAESSATSHAISHLKSSFHRVETLAKSQEEESIKRSQAEETRGKAQLRELVRMRVENLISDEEFHQERRAISSALASSSANQGKAFSERISSAIADLDAISAHLMGLADAWRNITPEYQRRFQQFIIQGGYPVGAVGTAQKGRLLSFFAAPLPVDTRLVPHTGETWNQLVDEIASLAAIFRESRM